MVFLPDLEKRNKKCSSIKSIKGYREEESHDTFNTEQKEIEFQFRRKKN